MKNSIWLAWRNFVIGALLLVLTSCTFPLTPPITPTPPNAAADLDAFALNQRLGRGINLGNALEAPTEGAWGLYLQADHFQIIADAGFNSVRVPIRWSAHAMKRAPHTIDPRFFERIDWVVDQALAHHLLVILDNHNFEEVNSEPVLFRDRFLAIWQQIAEHYQSRPPEVLFELFNEPNGAKMDENWNALLQAGIAEIRKTNPTRTLIVGPTEWNNIYRLHNLELPAADQHLIVTFHYYEPFHFTHQGADWAEGSAAWLGTTWTGTAAEKSAVEQDFAAATSWAKQHKRPLFLGEFGAYSRADLTSRATWTAFVARTAEAQGFSWAYWEFGSGFGAYDRARKAWNEPLRKALLGP